MGSACCLNCSRIFKAKPHLKMKYCSRACWKTYLASHSAYLPRYRRNCNGCGKYYEGEGKKFCGLECAGIHSTYKNQNNFKQTIGLGSLPRLPLIKRKYSTLVHRARQKSLLYPNYRAFVFWYTQQSKICYYCGIPEEIWETLYYGKQFKFSLSIDRKDNSLGYELSNMVLACHVCNVVKNQFLSESEMLDVAQRYLKPKWQARVVSLTANSEV